MTGAHPVTVAPLVIVLHPLSLFEVMEKNGEVILFCLEIQNERGLKQSRLENRI